MFAKILAFLLIASPLMAVDYDTLFYGDIDDSEIGWNTDPAGGWPPYYRPYGGATETALIEKSTAKRRMVVRFDADGLAQVNDTNAIDKAILYYKAGLFSNTYSLKIYALTNDRNWTEGTMTGSNEWSYGHQGLSWMCPAQPPYPDTMTGTLPSAFDWRDSNFVSTVKAQGSCGSCWAHAVIAQIEAAHKKNVVDWTTTNNSEDGTGADRTAAPMLTPSPEITATGWEYRPIPSWLVNNWYSTSGWDNGVILMPDSGSVKVNTSENASNKPHLIVNCVTRDDASAVELRLDITNTNLLDSYIQSANPTVNYGAGDTALINATNFMVIRADSFNAVIKTLLAADGSLANDTFQFATSCSLQLYMTKYSTNQAVVRAHQLIKNKFIEDSVTWNRYRGDKEWGTAGANKAEQLDLSEQQLVSCITSSDCADGGQISEQFFYFRDNDSVLTEASFRYNSSTTSDDIACLDTFGTAYAADVGWVWRVPSNTERVLKQALMIQPLSVRHGTNASFKSYAYSTSNSCWYGADDDSAHAVELIGWNDNDTCDLDGGIGTWIIKNQYGSGWGQDGFAYVSQNGTTDFTASQAANGTNASVVISVTDTVPYWSTAGILGGSEVAGLVAITPAITANGWNAIEIPAWVLRAMKNGKLSRSLLFVAETEAGASVSGVQFATTENATSADRPYLVLRSIPDSQLSVKIGNSKIGNAGIGR